MRIATRYLVPLVFAATLACAGSDDPMEPGGGGAAPDSTVSVWAGTGSAGFIAEGRHRLQSRLYQPIDVEFTETLGTFIVDWQNHRIRQVKSDGTLHTIIGTEIFGDGPLAPEDIFKDMTEPWPALECALNHPTSVFERDDGMLVIVSWHNHKLREYDPATKLEYVFSGGPAGCSADNISAKNTLWNQVSHGLQAPDGKMYFLDQRNQCVRVVEPAGASWNVRTVVAQPVCDQDVSGGYSGDDGPPLDAEINIPSGGNPPPGGGLAMDDQGRLYISDTMNNVIRRVDFVANKIVTVAGNGTAGFGGDGGDPLGAMLNNPLDIEIGPHGRLYIADTGNCCVRVVDFEENTINTIAGVGGVSGYSGNGGPATEATFDTPRGIAFDKSGDLYVVDTWNNVIRVVDLN